jgi:hypothetical protein
MRVYELIQALNAADPTADVLWYDSSNDQLLAAGIRTYEAAGLAVIVDRWDECESSPQGDSK